MTIPDDSGRNQSAHCPYLGMGDDESTAFAFSSRWNHCYKAEPIAVPTLTHQGEVCLDAYQSCPVFQRTGKAPFPKDMVAKTQRKTPRVFYIGVSILLVVAVFLLLFCRGFFKMPSFDLEQPKTSPPAQTVLLPTATQTQPAPVPTASFLQQPAMEESSGSSLCAYPFDTLIGNKRRFVVHQIKAGENMSVLALQHQSIPDAISAVNPDLELPLNAGTIIVIPVGVATVEGLSPLRAVQVDESDLSVKEMAEKLEVELSVMMGLNYQDVSCHEFQGWLILPVIE